MSANGSETKKNHYLCPIKYTDVEQLIINHLNNLTAMKKFFTLLTMCLLASAAWALDVTFVAGVDNGTSDGTAKPFVIEKEGIKIDISNGLANSSHYRIYKNQTATISSSIGAITQVVFECTANGDAQYGPGCFTVSPEGYTYADKIGTWVGSANPVVFTASANQVRATKIIVTVGQPGLSAPTITPAAGTYYAPIEVNITCGTPGAKIYYTTNGNTPTTSSTEFKAPFTVNTNMTIKAISAQDGETSDVVEAAYEFKSATPVANIAEFQNADDDAVLVFTNPVNVLVQSGQRMFVEDASGRALFYGNTGQTYKNGDVIPAGFVGTKTTWDGEPELKDLANFQPASSNSPINPEVITTVDVDATLFAEYVQLDNVTFDKTNKLVIDDNGSAPYYCNLSVKDDDIQEGQSYTLIAIVGSHGKAPNTVYQLLPVKLIGAPLPGGFGFEHMKATADNEMVTFEKNVIVVKQAGKYLYAMDEDKKGYGLIYGTLDKKYNDGDVIPFGFSGKKTTYNAEPELAEPFENFGDAIRNVGDIKAYADEITIPMVGTDIWAHYVKLKDVKINTSDNTLTDANGNSCALYNGTFNIAFPADLSKAYTVYGVVGSYGKAPNTVYQILPTFIDAPIDTIPVAGIDELFALQQGQIAIFTTPLTAIYQNANNLYIQDVKDNQTLVFGNVPGTFVNGDLINDAVVKWSEYQGAKQIIPLDNFVVAGKGEKVEPIEPQPLEEVSQEYVNYYFSFEEMTIIEEEGKFYMIDPDETGRIQLYDKFGLFPNGFPMDDTYYIEGFLTIYRGELEFYPIVIEGPIIPFLPGDVNGDGEVNIADINALIDIILGGTDNSEGRSDVNRDGEVNIADINAVIDIILNS